MVKKLIRAPVNPGAVNISDTMPVSTSKQLYWFTCRLNGQKLDAVLDSGATVTCVARRCVTGSPQLNQLPLIPYTGKPLLDANRKPLSARHVISTKFVVGVPALSVDVNIVVVDDLPYSCLVGTNLLSKLKTWGIDNTKSILTLNSSVVHLRCSPECQNLLNLVTCDKTVLQPGETKRITTRANGSGLSASRPITEQLWLVEGVNEREHRTAVRVFPALTMLGRKNDSIVQLHVTNTSPSTRSIGKGTKIAQAHTEFSKIEEDNEIINIVYNGDVIQQLCDRKNFQHLSETQYGQVQSLLVEYKDVFTISNERIGCAENSFFHIDVNNLEPVAVPLRRVPLHKEHIMTALLQKYEDLGLIEHIDSPFRAPTVLVEKKNPGNSDDLTDRYRLCIDYRELNKRLPDSAWPSPFIEHCLDAAAGAIYMSSLDFNNGYFQIPCTNAAKCALAFSPGVGYPQYTFNGMPPGVKSASSVFQQTMERTFRGLEDRILPPYYDDITVKGRSFEDHLSNVAIVLERIRRCGFTLNALKCKFFQTRVHYLGHIIENGQVFLDPSRIRSILDAPTPTNVKSLRRFIGMAQFCSRFVSNFNVILTPLYNLTKINTPFVWDSNCQHAFDTIKRQLTEPPVLKSPSSTDEFVLETDASDTGIGSCLKVLNNGREHIVGYHSEKLQEPQCRWPIVEKEAYAILKGTNKFRHYLIAKKFILKTDNRVLSYMKTSKSKKLANWALQLSDFEFDIVHIPSKNNSISDYFSRIHEDVNVVSILEPKISTEDLVRRQNEDPNMRQAILYVHSKRNFDVTKLGTLKRFRKFLSVDENNVLRWKTKIVLPIEFRPYILEVSHDHPVSGHFAEDRTWKNVTDSYFWPDAHNDVINWIRSCKPCNERDVKTYVNRPLQPIASSERFELVCYDIAGPFIPSRTVGNIYALIVVDHFSKWPEVIPLKNIRASTLATAIFEQWCCRYGIMTQLHSDGAPNVHGEVVKELCKKIGTVKSKSSRLHPQGDGMAEAMIKILKRAVAKQVDTHGTDWDSYLQPTAFAVRGSLNNSTKCTPAELVLGNNVIRPIDVSIKNNEKSSFANKQARDFASELTEKIDNSTQVVNENLNRSRSKMKATYDKKNSNHKFKIGDSVMLWWPYYEKGIPRSFQPKWKGPFIIKRLNGNTNCTLSLEDGSEKHVHLNQLKLVTPRRNWGLGMTDSDLGPDLELDIQNGNRIDIFDHLCAEDESDYHSAAEDLDDDRWCGLNQQNVLNFRTRSQVQQVGDG